MAGDVFRFPLGRGARVALALSALLLAAPASALPIDVFYDGPGGIGVSSATRDAAMAAGIPLVSGTLESAAPYGTTQVFDSQSIRFGLPTTGTENWTLTNGTQQDRVDIYLVFATPLDNSVDFRKRSEPVVYDPNDVGLTLRNGEGGTDWVILETPVPGATPTGFESNLVYFPAVSLGSLASGETSDVFQLDYVLQNPQIFIQKKFVELGVPTWRIFTVSTPVPEPSTVLLIACALGALVLGGRGRA